MSPECAFSANGARHLPGSRSNDLRWPILRLVLPTPGYVGCLDAVGKGSERVFFLYATPLTSLLLYSMNRLTANDFVRFAE